MKKFLNKFGIKIILIIVGIIVISNVVDLFLANYKLKNNKILSVPTFYMIDSNDERIDLDLARYKIMNEYDNKENVLVSNYLEYDFQNTGIIIVYPNEEYKIGIDENINIEDYDISVSNFRNGHPEFIEREYKFEDGMFIEKSDTEIPLQAVVPHRRNSSCHVHTVLRYFVCTGSAAHERRSKRRPLVCLLRTG